MNDMKIKKEAYSHEIQPLNMVIVPLIMRKT